MCVFCLLKPNGRLRPIRKQVKIDWLRICGARHRQGINMTAVQTYKNLFVRSLQYVDRLKSKDHPDVNNFKSLICSMMDKASEGIKGTDSDDDVANVQQTMLRDIGLPRGGLEGGGRFVLRKSWFKTKLRQSAGYHGYCREVGRERWLGCASPCRRLSSRPPTLPYRWTSSLFGRSILVKLDLLAMIQRRRDLRHAIKWTPWADDLSNGA